MPIKFSPHYTITPKIMANLMRIESLKEKISHLPLTPTVLNSLRETARLCTTHYSTMIEGNKLTTDQIKKIVKHQGHFPGREREECEVKGYYVALKQVEKWALKGVEVTEDMIQTIHALVMSNGKEKVHPTPYRDGQNVIRDGMTNAIVYMPPEAKDVESLMSELVVWIKENELLPAPLLASIAHYQFATIHPYYDGNGRTARLLTTLILHLKGYDLKGLYSLEEYYACHLNAYYEAIDIGTSHNYYYGRIEADITKWIDYFIEGMCISFENVLRYMKKEQDDCALDKSHSLRKLDPKQRKVLVLFEESDIVTARQIAELFGFQPRTSSALCAKWVKEGFLKIVDPSNKGRTYALNVDL
jgi:Fic family protein